MERIIFKRDYNILIMCSINGGLKAKMDMQLGKVKGEVQSEYLMCNLSQRNFY